VYILSIVKFLRLSEFTELNKLKAWDGETDELGGKVNVAPKEEQRKCIWCSRAT